MTVFELRKLLNKAVGEGKGREPVVVLLSDQAEPIHLDIPAFPVAGSVTLMEKAQVPAWLRA